MREAGVNLVTVGCSRGRCSSGRRGSTPGPGSTRCSTCCTQRHRVDLATPTAAPPNWLLTAHPEVLPVDATERRERPGGRLGWCPASPVFREHALRIVDAIAERYGKHPAVRLWHVSNELGGGNARCFCEVSAADFRRWLRTGTKTSMRRTRLGHGVLGPHLHVVRRGCRRRAWGRRCAQPRPGTRLRAVLLGRPARALHRGAHRDRTALGRAGHHELHGRAGSHVSTTPDGAARRDPRERPLHARRRPGPGRGPRRLADRMRGIARGRTPWLLMEHSTGGPSWQQRNRAKEPAS